MKKLFPISLISAFFVLGVAQASDIPATLSISGSATNMLAGCTVNINPSTISLESIPLNAMPWQGGNTIPRNPVNVSISGSSECYALALANRLAYRFVGTPDAVEGPVLANTDTSTQAAAGVGIGLYDMHGKFLSIKDTVPVANLERMSMQVVSLKGQRATEGSVTGTLTIQLERL